MKSAYSFNIISLLSAFVFLSSCTQSNSLDSKNLSLSREKKEESKKPYPNDLWLNQRTYNGSFDTKAYIKKMEKVKLFNSKPYSKSSASDLDESWTPEGPGNIGGRFNALAVSPIDNNTIYAGAANGGIFKTIDGGTIWNPIFDDQAYLSIGALTIDPNNPNTIYAGTGDRNFGGGSHLGNGIYKSTNAGLTWTQSGLINPSIVTDIIVDPLNSERIFASTLGNVFEKNIYRGVYRSINGGSTWENVLFVSDSSGVVDLLMDPNNSDVLYASVQNRTRTETSSLVSGPDVGIYKTINGGNSWIELSNGLPSGEQCRIGLAISPENSNTIYACYTGINLDVLDVYKSNNAGLSWTGMDVHEAGLPIDIQGGFGWYFGEIYQNPYNNDQLIIPGVDMYTTLDGGDSWYANVPPWYTYEVHADKHAIVFLDSLSYIIATDGGLYKTTDNGTTWVDIENMPVTQFYHIDVDPLNPGIYGGGAQDNGSMQGNSTQFNEWQRLYGGDGFRLTFLEDDDDGNYYQTQNGGLRYVNIEESENIDLRPELESLDRVNWDMPYYINEDEELLFSGTSQVLLMESAPYGSYEIISEDLTRVGLGSYQGQISRHTISEIVQPVNDNNTVFIGTSDGLVWRGENDGSQWNWIDISNGLPQRYVTALRVSPNDSETLYVGFSGYKFNEDAAYLFKSMDNGNTWVDISGNLPQIVVNDILILENINEDNLFAALDGGVYYTENGGDNWTLVGNDLPLVTVSELDVDLVNKRLIAGTYSRSMYSFDINWVFDDLIEPVGIQENLKPLEVYPNPVKQYLNFDKTKISNLNIYNVHGQLVFAEPINPNQSKIDISILGSGTYFLKSEGYFAKIIKE